MAIAESRPAAAGTKGDNRASGSPRFKKFALKLHLYLGLAAAIFLLTLGVTGSVIAFEQEIPRWLNPGLYYVQPGTRALPEESLVRKVEQDYAPALVGVIHISRSPRIAQVMWIVSPRESGQASPPRRVFVDPYNGAVLGTLPLRTTSENILQTIHNIHLRIGMGNAGKFIISIAGLMLCFEVVFGGILWLRLKRTKLKRSGSRFRRYFDLHTVVGIYALACLLLMGITGTAIGFEDFFMNPLIYKMTNSTPPPRPPILMSAPIAGARSISVDQAMRVARQTLPGAAVTDILLPATSRGTFMFRMRIPWETAPTVMSMVTIDQYSGRVLWSWDLRKSLVREVIRFNRSIHTGDLLGFPGHVLVSLFSLALVFMVVTGVVIWWKKLAI